MTTYRLAAPPSTPAPPPPPAPSATDARKVCSASSLRTSKWRLTAPVEAGAATEAAPAEAEGVVEEAEEEEEEGKRSCLGNTNTGDMMRTSLLMAG